MSISIAIFIWLISFLISIVIGSRKGQLIGGAILGLIFGPLGAVIVLLSSDKNKIQCPFCAEKIQKTAKICPYCKSKLNNI